jgi:uncharacterized protein (DUF58 family)
LSSKNNALVNQPLLTPPEVNECIQQGQLWSGNGVPWPMREMRRGHSGDLASLQQGGGIDFSETRPYQAGDEPRHMNWRATARSGRPQVRVFQQDLTATSYFLIDRRSNMRFGTRQRLKVTQAARLAIFLATWEARSGTELGSLILNESPQWQPPVSGHDGIYQLAQLACKPCPPLFDFPEVDMKLALSLLAEQIPLGSHLYLFSDFFDLEENLLPRLYQLGEQHRVWAINIHDPAEQTFPKAGHLQLVWNQASNTTFNIINTNDADIQQQQYSYFEQRQQQIKNLCDLAGIFYTAVFSNENNIAKALQTTQQ